MTRRSTVAVITLLAGLLSLGSATAVSAREQAVVPHNTSLTVGAGPRVCTTPQELFMLCYQQQAGGAWTKEELQADDTWLVVETLAGPPALVGFADMQR